MRIFGLIPLTLLFQAATASSVCPDSFFYFLYDPLIISSMNRSEPNGPFANILRQAHEICCPLNSLTNKPLRATELKDDLDIYEKLLTSYSQDIVNSMAFTNLKAYASNTSGLFGPIENDASEVSHIDGDNVKVIASQGFYLISRPDVNGFPMVRSKVFDVLLKSWPLLVFLLLAYSYASMFLWLLDQVFKLNLFPGSFVQGFCYGLWWLSSIIFTPTSLIARTSAKTWIVRCFISFWTLASMLFMAIFISILTTSLTIYANNGQSLENKVIGVNKYSSDKNWLRLENSLVKEYARMNDLFVDLEEMKLDYILVDEVYAKFYARVIESKFHVARNVKRRLTFEIFLRGFNKENLNCFHALTSIVAQNWFKNSISYNHFRIRKGFKYFDVTAELLRPRVNVVLFVLIGVVLVLLVAGSLWQFLCMKKSENFYAYALKSGGFNAFFKDETLKKIDEHSMNFYDRALINARDEAILRQQSCHSTKSNMSTTSSIKPSIYFKNSIASSRSNNYFQVRIPEEQEPQQTSQQDQQQTPSKRFSPKRIRSLKERSLEFFNRSGSCSFKRDKIKSSMSHKSMMGYDPTIKSPNANIKALSLNRLHNKKSDVNVNNNNSKKELSCQIKCIFGSSAATITEDTTQTSYKPNNNNNNNNTDTNNFLTDSSLQNIEPLRNSDSFYLGEFMSVKL